MVCLDLDRVAVSKLFRLRRDCTAVQKTVSFESFQLHTHSEISCKCFSAKHCKRANNVQTNLSVATCVV